MNYSRLCDHLLGIAMQEDLQYAESTIGNNGYPQSLRPCIYGFKDFAHYKEVRDKYNLEGIYLKWRDGQQLPNRSEKGCLIVPYELISEDFGDNYTFWFQNEAESFFEMCIEDLLEFEEFFEKYNIKLKGIKSFEEINNQLDEIEIEDDNYDFEDTFCMLKTILEHREEIYQKIKNLKSKTQVVITECGHLYDYDVETNVMQYTSDVWHYAIALEY